MTIHPVEAAVGFQESVLEAGGESHVYLLVNNSQTKGLQEGVFKDGPQSCLPGRQPGQGR